MVEVELVEVELTRVVFCKVVEPITNRSPEELMVVVAVCPILSELAVTCPPKREVEVASVEVERVMLSKMLAPEKVLLLARRVEEAVESRAQPKTEEE